MSGASNANLINIVVLFKYILVFFRITGFFVFAPFFSSRIIPDYIKAGFILILSIVIGQVVTFGNTDVTLIEFILILVKEILTGMAMGLISSMIFNSLYIAGEMIDTEIGFGMVNLIDPSTQSTKPLIGNFIYYIAIMTYLVLNGHLSLIKNIVLSYQYMPINNFTVNNAVINQIMDTFGYMMLLGVKIAIPIVATVFLTDVCLGIMSKIVPQLNVFINGLPVKIFIGFLILMLIIPSFIVLLDSVFSQIDVRELNLIKIF